MSVESRGSVWARTSLALVGAMWVLPFLYYPHYFPISTFYQEWGAALLGLCAASLLVKKGFWQQAEIPRVAMFPLGLALLVLVQMLLGKVAYWEQGALVIFYLLWATLMIILGRYLRFGLSLPVIASTLAMFLLVGAEISALAGVVQHFSWHNVVFDKLVDVQIGNRISGNLAQFNHFADYITLGLISLGLLYTSRRFRIWQTALLAVPMLFVLALSGSRSPWFYLSCMLGLAFLWQRWNVANRSLLYFGLALLLGFGLMNVVVQLPGLDGGAATSVSVEGGGVQVTSLGRLVDEAGGQGESPRLRLWRDAWEVFTRFPILGAGVGQYPWQHFLLGAELRDTSNSTSIIVGVGSFDHSHNLVLQLAAEMGLAGLAVLFATIGFWLWRAPKEQLGIYHWWGYALLAVLGIHSMMEYPLWYVFFLGVAAILLGGLDNSSYRLELCRYGRLLTATLLSFGVVLLSLMLLDHRKLEQTDGRIYHLSTQVTDDYAKEAGLRRVSDRLMSMREEALLLRPYVDYQLAQAGGLEFIAGASPNEQLLRFRQTPLVAYREAVLLAQNGRMDEAQMQIVRAIWAFPEDFPTVAERLRTLADEDTNPERFSSLLEFALEKYEERQREFKVGS